MPELNETEQGLTPAQRDVVLHGDGPLLVLAGPGSGKTRVITRRIARLISLGASPHSILALTFTNKAATGMRDRVAALLGVDDPRRMGLQVSTFHSFCALLLRQFGPNSPGAAGVTALAEGFSIYDSEDSRAAIGRATDSVGLDRKNWPAGQVAERISRAKNSLIDARSFAAEAGDFQSRTIARIYEAYESALARNNALDFDDLLLRTANMLKRDESVRGHLHRRFQHVLVDEYQDTNYAQFVVASAIAAGSGNFMVVGDPDQSIYGWRGADIRNILEFETHFPGARVLPLGENFRSTGHIVAAAAGLIGSAAKRKGKELWTQLPQGEKPRVLRLLDEFAESALVADAIEEAARGGIPYSQMAILYRMNWLSRTLEEELRRRAIPYVIVRGTAFYERKEVKDALAYLRLLANPVDEVSLRRALEVPPKGIGDATMRRAEMVALSQQMNLFQALAATDLLQLKPAGQKAITRFLVAFTNWRRTLEGGFASELAEFVRTVIAGSGLPQYLDKSAESSEDAEERKANLDELVNAAAQHAEELLGVAQAADGMTLLQALQSFLATVTLVAEADVVDPERGAVTLMTLHASKGLEFHTVAIVGVEHGILPHSRSDHDEEQLEEERRLLFVGMTRAERALLLTEVATRSVRGMRLPTITSRFMREIPDESVVRLDAVRARLDPIGTQGCPPRLPAEGVARQWRVGMMVRHAQFGTGRVEAVLPRAGLTSVSVKFSSGLIKNLVTEYAKLVHVSG